MLRQGLPKQIGLIAYLAITILTFPNASSAFWLRFIWKNGLIGPDATYEASSGLILYLLTGTAPLLSDTFKFPQGAVQCQTMQDLAPRDYDPPDPIPGMIGILDSSPRTGRKVEYLFFFDDEVCGTAPSMTIRLEPSERNRGTSGNFYFINLLDHAVPPVKSWKQADPDDPIDQRVIRAFGRSEQTNQVHPSRLVVNMMDPTMAGSMRWRYVMRDERVEPGILLRDDAEIETTLGSNLIQPLGAWVKREEAYRKQQEGLNVDFGSEDFNFVPTEDFTLSSQRVAAYMVQEEHERLGLPVPRIRRQREQETRRRPSQQTVEQTTGVDTQAHRQEEPNTNQPANVPMNTNEQPSGAGQSNVNWPGWAPSDYPVDRVSELAGINPQPVYDPYAFQQYNPSNPYGSQQMQQYNYGPSGSQLNLGNNQVQQPPNNNQDEAQLENFAAGLNPYSHQDPSSGS
ncbi:hypothetical protein TWF481_008768 [Arthrobotrys musiformis]|uniref:Uncharacterized protein n=1 Tax=Arthrobotrys musiformis TaxID=47236 RepID=A0AAV9WA12_9PEZI